MRGIFQAPGSSPGQALRVRPGWVPEPGFLAQQVAELERLAVMGEAKAVIEKLYEIVPTFSPVGVNGNRVRQGAGREATSVEMPQEGRSGGQGPTTG